MSDKYEELENDLKKCFHINYDNSERFVGNGAGAFLKRNEDILLKIITKARKFDQLVEARKLATPGEWNIADDDFIAVNGVGDIAALLPPNADTDAAFITLAANLTREETP